MKIIPEIFKLQLILFTSLLILWNLFTPALEGADEIGHYCHADYIAHRNHLPDLNKIDGCFLWHPPLYYLYLTPAIKLFNLSEFKKEDFVKNPNFEDLKNGQYSQFSHTKEELIFNWNKKQLQVHLLRLQSSFLAILIFALTWKISKYAFTKETQRNVAMLVFFNPMFIHIFSTLTNVSLISFIITLLIAIDIVCEKKKGNLGIFMVVGTLLGLGYITKISIFGVIFAKLYIFFRNWVKTPRFFFNRFVQVATITIAFLLTGGWYLLRSLNLYGTLFEADIAAKIPGAHVHKEFIQSIGFFNYISSLSTTLFRTFWSGYGALTVNFPDIVNLILLWFVILITYSVATNYKNLNAALKICAAYLISIFLALIVMNFKLKAMHAKDLFGAYLPIAYLFSFGVFKLKDIVKKKKLSVSFQILSIAIMTYFFAQSEIVKIIKFEISLNLILTLLIKFVIVLFLKDLIIRAMANLSLTKSSIKLYSYGLFLADTIILTISTYLFYVGFL